jgi:hypothetical protein
VARSSGAGVPGSKGSGQDHWIDTLHQNGDLFTGEVAAMLVTETGSEAAAKVVLEVEGRPLTRARWPNRA